MKTLEEKIADSSYIRKKSLLAFGIFFLLIAGALVSWKWLNHQPESAGALRPLRSVLTFNEAVFSTFISDNHQSKTYSLSAVAPKTRVNGDAGMSDNFDPASWQLQVVRKPGDTLHITLDDIKSLPKTDIIFDFKCIEGWSQVTHWAGVKFTDFVKKYGLENQSNMGFVGLSTPDNEYYVGIDRKSMLHPQTILCYEMNGAPLPFNQGAPLRLIIPVKYGVKHLKRVGTIYFSNDRPKDYWFERGYDYFCGL
jgi:DMSO/TMAO reductase YedYZ molybdopterin-dependent catalytic subunit